MEPLSLQHPIPSTNGRIRAVRPVRPGVLGMQAAALNTLSQPIFDISGPRPKMQAVECLTRGPKGSAYESAEALFSHARRHHAEAGMDEAAARLAISRAGDLAAAHLDLHVNVHASSLSASYASSLLSTCWEHGLPPSQIVLEIVERGNPVERDALREAIQHLKNLGFRIALDDIGMGQSNFLMLYLTRPEVVKIDRFFVHGVSHDRVRRAMVVAIQTMAGELGAHVVAEGVEEPAPCPVRPGHSEGAGIPVVSTRRIQRLDGSGQGLPGVRPVPRPHGHRRVQQLNPPSGFWSFPASGLNGASPCSTRVCATFFAWIPPCS